MKPTIYQHRNSIQCELFKNPKINFTRNKLYPNKSISILEASNLDLVNSINMSSANQEVDILDASNCCLIETNGDKTEVIAENYKTKIVWRILNFSKRQEQKGESIDSSSFTLLSPNDIKTKWRLSLYPNGHSKAKPGNFVVALFVEEVKAIASFKLSISSGKDVSTVSSNGSEFYPGPLGKGITEPKEKWLSDEDVLIVVCEISVLEASKNMKERHSLKMMDDLTKAYSNINSMDVTVTCEDASFECNKFMLTARSPVFQSMFIHDMKESQTNVVNIKDIEPKILEEMLRYIHTGEAPNITEISPELIAAADLYQLDELKNSCQDLLIEDLDVKTSIHHLILSDMYSAQKLRKEAMKFVCENMKLISSTCDWKKELAGYPSLMAEIIEFLMNEK